MLGTTSKIVIINKEKLYSTETGCAIVKFVDDVEQVQNRIEERIRRIGKGRYGRVLKMARKPTRDEYKKTLQITSLGIILIGGLGFLIYYLWANVPPFIYDVMGW